MGLVDPGTELYMLPCVRCNDCYEDVPVSNPDHANRAFRAGHMFGPTHAQRLRERLIPNSKTIRQAVYFITMGGQEASEYYITCLTTGYVSARQLRLDYASRCGESICALALRNGEKEILHLLLEDSEVTEWDQIPKLAVQWSQALKETETAKMLLYAALESLLGSVGHDTLTLVEKLIRDDHRAGALEVIKLTAWCFDTLPLDLACWFGQQKYISTMLPARSRSRLEWTCYIHAPKPASHSAPAVRMLLLLKAAAWIHQVEILSPKDKSHKAKTFSLDYPCGIDVS